MKKLLDGAPVCYGHWFKHAFEGECVECNADMQKVCRVEAIMRERIEKDANYLAPDYRFCRSGNCN